MTCSSIKVTFATEASTCQCLQGQTFSGSSIWLMQLSVRIDLIVLQSSPGQFGAEIYMDYLKYFYTTVKLVILFIKPRVCDRHTTSRFISKNQQKTNTEQIVFNIFIHLFSLFLFVLKFILCVFWTSLFFFQRLLSSNSSKQNHQKWFHVVQSTWRTFLLASPGCHSTAVVQHCVRKFHFNQISTARFKDTLDDLLGWKSETLHGCKCSFQVPKCLLNTNTVKYTRHYCRCYYHKWTVA